MCTYAMIPRSLEYWNSSLISGCYCSGKLMPFEEIKALFFMLIEPLNAGIPPLLDPVPSEPDISLLARKLVVACLSVEPPPPSLELEPCTIACCWFWNFFCDCFLLCIISSLGWLGGFPYCCFLISFNVSFTALIASGCSESDGIFPPSIDIF